MTSITIITITIDQQDEEHQQDEEDITITITSEDEERRFHCDHQDEEECTNLRVLKRLRKMVKGWQNEEQKDSNDEGSDQLSVRRRQLLPSEENKGRK